MIDKNGDNFWHIVFRISLDLSKANRERYNFIILNQQLCQS